MPTSGKASVQIETAQIPESSRMGLLAIIYDATAEYFKQPGVAEAFERWKAEREKQAVQTAGM